MTDDELSELAEALADACDEAVARGVRIVPVRMGAADCNCPIGSLLGNSYPPPLAACRAGIGVEIAHSFMSAFDGDPPKQGYRHDGAYALGKQFRKVYYGK